MSILSSGLTSQIFLPTSTPGRRELSDRKRPGVIYKWKQFSWTWVGSSVIQHSVVFTSPMKQHNWMTQLPNLFCCLPLSSFSWTSLKCWLHVGHIEVLVCSLAPAPQVFSRRNVSTQRKRRHFLLTRQNAPQVKSAQKGHPFIICLPRVSIFSKLVKKKELWVHTPKNSSILPLHPTKDINLYLSPSISLTIPWKFFLTIFHTTPLVTIVQSSASAKFYFTVSRH